MSELNEHRRKNEQHCQIKIMKNLKYIFMTKIN